MKLWGFWRSKENSAVSTDAVIDVDANSEAPKYLDDVEPKFHDVKGSGIGNPFQNVSLSKVLKSLSLEDFKQVPQMTCFRKSMLTGLGIGVTVFAVLKRSQPTSKCANWGFGAFLTGSIITWEQCRVRAYKSKQNVMLAKARARQVTQSSNQGADLMDTTKTDK